MVATKGLRHRGLPNPKTCSSSTKSSHPGGNHACNPAWLPPVHFSPHRRRAHSFTAHTHFGISLGIPLGKENQFPAELPRVRNTSLDQIPPVQGINLSGSPPWYLVLVTNTESSGWGLCCQHHCGKGHGPFLTSRDTPLIYPFRAKSCKKTLKIILESQTTFCIGKSAFSPSAPQEAAIQLHVGEFLVLLPPLPSLQV